MTSPASFPWATVIANAIWICGLAEILAAFGWHDYKRRERASDVAAGFSLRKDKRNLKVATTDQDERGPKTAAAKKAEPLLKPVLLGLIMVAGGISLSVNSPMFAVIFAIAAFGLVVVFVKRFFPARANAPSNDR